ncbi:MAG: hypothetical protein ACYCW6_08650 [Candidatus Xenobia bacterium]
MLEVASSPNPILWREKRRTQAASLSILSLLNILGALGMVIFLSDRLFVASASLLPGWAWWSLGAVLAGTMYQTWNRVSAERSRGTLELLRSTPLVPEAMLRAQVRLALQWLARAYPLLGLWALWGVMSGEALHLLVLAPLAVLMATCGALVGVRLALSHKCSGWSLLGGALATLVLVAIPSLLDAVSQSTGYLYTPREVSTPPPLLFWSTGGAFAAILALLAVACAWLWSADMRALSGFELQENGAGLERRMQVGPCTRMFDAVLLRGATLFGLQQNPFFMRERARALRKVTREPAVILTALLPAMVPYFVAHLLGLNMSTALAWCAVPLIFLWWMAGAGATRDAMTRELDTRTLDAVRVSPIPPEDALLGIVFGRLYPFAIGWLASLPIWLAYACTPQVPGLAALMLPLVLAGIGTASAVGGLRASCSSLNKKGDNRYYSEAVLNPALWAWAAASPLLGLLGVGLLHPLLEALHLISPYVVWMPIDVVSLFPTWFAVPGLLPTPTWLIAILIHGLIIKGALQQDLQFTWTAMQKAMDDDIMPAGRC